MVIRRGHINFSIKYISNILMATRKGSVRVYFKEEQRLGNSPQIWFMYIAFLIFLAGSGWVFYQELILSVPRGSRPTSDAQLQLTLVISLIVFSILIFFMHCIKLVTKIDEKSISIRFTPLQRKPKVITKEQISRYKIRKYKPIIEYGGWGLRATNDIPISYRRRRFGIAYNVSGNIGLQLYLTNTRKILIGTQNPTGIEHAMKKLMDEGGMIDG